MLRQVPRDKKLKILKHLPTFKRNCDFVREKIKELVPLPHVLSGQIPGKEKNAGMLHPLN